MYGKFDLIRDALDQFCPECGGPLLFDAVSKRFSCKSCGLFLTREQLSDLRFKPKNLGPTT